MEWGEEENLVLDGGVRESLKKNIAVLGKFNPGYWGYCFHLLRKKHPSEKIHVFIRKCLVNDSMAILHTNNGESHYNVVYDRKPPSGKERKRDVSYVRKKRMSRRSKANKNEANRKIAERGEEKKKKTDLTR